MNLARQVVDMNLDLVEALRRQRQTHEPIHSNGATPSRPSRKRQGMEQAAWPHMLRFGTLTGITRPNIRGNIASLPRPVRKPLHQGGGFVAAYKMPAERSVRTFSDNAMAETAPAWDAQAIRLALTASIE